MHNLQILSNSIQMNIFDSKINLLMHDHETLVYA